MAIFIYYVSQKKLQVIGGGGYSVRATSRKGACINDSTCQTKKNIGPIPKGEFYMLKREFDNPNIIWDIGRTFAYGDWGDWRIPIHPANKTKTYDRSGFFMHGGAISGSAGCIDVGGGIFGNAITDKIKKSILNSSDRIQLWVR